MIGEKWPAIDSSFPRCRELTDQKLGRADIAIFFGHHAADDGAEFGGAAYLATACWNKSKAYKMQLNKNKSLSSNSFALRLK